MIKYILNHDHVSLEHITLSSDSFGSQPRFNEKGECIGLTYASPRYLHKTIVKLVKNGVLLQEALKLLTTTPANLLGKTGHKGCIAIGSDADLLILDNNLEINSLFARGTMAIDNGKVIMKGRFE
jgi:beta-aspartyl-dipeptidase (metallo-type)